MPAINLRLASGADGNFASMLEADQTAASRTDGWTVAKIAAANSSEFDNGTKQASGSFSTQAGTPKPASFLTGATANAIKSQNPYTGTFDLTSWILTFAVRATTASSQAGRMRVRVFASVNADGSSARELTGSTQVGTTSSALSTTVDVTTVVTWTPGSVISVTKEYLFFVIAWEITTASGSNSGDVVIRTGQSAGGSFFVTGVLSPFNYSPKPRPLLITALRDNARKLGIIVPTPAVVHPDVTVQQAVTEIGDVINDASRTVNRDGDGLRQKEFGWSDVSNFIFINNPVNVYSSKFTTTDSFSLDHIQINASKVGSPTDNVIVELHSDSGGLPGTVIATTNFAASSLTGSFTWVSVPLQATLSASSTYWVTVRRSGSTDVSNYVLISGNNDVSATSARSTDGGSSFSANTWYIAFYTYAFDSSYGLWRASTNLVANGGAETTNPWAGGSRVTTECKFGVASVQAIGGQSLTPNVTGLSAGNTYTFSLYIKAPNTDTYSIFIQWMDISNAVISFSQSGYVTGTGNWIRLFITATAPVGTTQAQLNTSPNLGLDTYYVDGVQFEQQPYATPYIETDGATAGRNAGYVTAPAKVVDKTQGWVAFRVRPEWANGGLEPHALFDLNDGTANNRILLNYYIPGNQWQIARKTGGGAPDPALVTGTHAAGDSITVIAKWTAAQVSISLNGASFIDNANSNVPASVQNLFAIAEQVLSSDSNFDGEILWVAAGTGTLSDADAATIHGFGNAGSLDGYPSLSAPTFYWPADTALWYNGLGIATGVSYTDSVTITSTTSVISGEQFIPNPIAPYISPLLVKLNMFARPLDNSILVPTFSPFTYIDSAIVSGTTSVQSSESTDFLDTAGTVQGLSTIISAETTQDIEAATTASITGVTYTETTDFADAAVVAGITSIIFDEQYPVPPPHIQPILTTLTIRHGKFGLLKNNVLIPDQQAPAGYIDSAIVSGVTSIQSSDSTDFLDTAGTIQGTSSITGAEVANFVDASIIAGTTIPTYVETTDYVETITVASVTSLVFIELYPTPPPVLHAILSTLTLKFGKSILLHNNILTPDQQQAAGYVDSAVVASVTSIQSSDSTNFLDTAGTIQGTSTITGTETTDNIDLSTISGSSSVTYTELAGYVEASTVASSSGISTADTSDYVDGSVVPSITSVQFIEQYIPFSIVVGNATQPILINLAKFHPKFHYLFGYTLSPVTHTPVGYIDSSTVSTTTAVASVETAQFVDTATPPSVTSPSSTEFEDGSDANTILGKTTPSSTDILAAIDSNTVSGVSSITSVDIEAYIDSKTVPGITSITSTDVAAYLDAGTVSTVTSLTYTEQRTLTDTSTVPSATSISYVEFANYVDGTRVDGFTTVTYDEEKSAGNTDFATITSITSIISYEIGALVRFALTARLVGRKWEVIDYDTHYSCAGSQGKTAEIAGQIYQVVKVGRRWLGSLL